MLPSMTMENEGCRWNYVCDPLTWIIQVDPELSQDPYQWTRVSGEEDRVMPCEKDSTHCLLTTEEESSEPRSAGGL